MQKKKILLSFSGGLDTSAILPWLKEKHEADVIAYCADLGNAPNEGELKKWALELGAVDFIFEDLKDSFVSNFVFPALKAGAIYQNEYLLGTSLGRPLIAERLVFWAKELGCSAIAHGATGKGNDQLRIENSIAYLAPGIKTIAPWREWSFQSRADLIQFLQKKGFQFNAEEKKMSEDVNLFHRSCEGGILESPELGYSPSSILKWVNTDSSPMTSTRVEITFEAGTPTTLNGKKEAPHLLLSHLNEIAGKHGYGVADVIEERKIGFKSRGIYETPGGTVLFHTLRQLKHLCWDRETLSLANYLGNKYADCVYDGLWHSDAKSAVDAFFQQAGAILTGVVEFEISARGLTYIKRESPFSLFRNEMSSFESDSHQLNRYSEGICRMSALKQGVLGLRAGQVQGG